MLYGHFQVVSSHPYGLKGESVSYLSMIQVLIMYVHHVKLTKNNFASIPFLSDYVFSAYVQYLVYNSSYLIL